MSILFSKKWPAAPTMIHPSVGAEIEPIPRLPHAPEPNADSGARCELFRVEGNGEPSRILTEEPQTGADAAFVVRGLARRGPFAIVNRSGDERSTVALWDLASNDDLRRIGSPREGFLPAAETWADAAAVAVTCLPNGRMLLAVRYETAVTDRSGAPRGTRLFLDDGSGHFSTIEREIGRSPQSFDEFMELREPDGDGESALVLYYSGETRTSAEVYHNYYNHILFFGAKQPSGLEILKLGIDTGNIEEWFVAEKTLYFSTVDSRKPGAARRGVWKLNLEHVL